MILQLILLVSVFATSVLSGILGMAGGMVLMAILVSTLPVAATMMIHGAVQATANGSRCWFLRRHIQWRILPPYLLGSALALAAFSLLSLVPDPAVVLLAIGILPWLARVRPQLGQLDMNRAGTSVVCGLLVTSAQLLAGVSGPLLDMFYLRSRLNRHEVVASKAVTQTLGHVLKLLYYGLMVGTVETLPIWFYAVAMATAVAGTRTGTLLLDHIPDQHFLRVSNGVILSISFICIIKGLKDLLHI